jgi:1-pyrroline-5-carboxylate dehydrogenase
MSENSFKITYATLSAPNAELHQRFDAALENLNAGLGQAHPMFINGREHWANETFDDISPIDTANRLGVFQKGGQHHIHQAITAARAASAGWKTTPWQQRVALMRKAADLISGRSFEIGALMSLEVGKNRLEALGDVQETVDLIRFYCDQMETNDGFARPMQQESPGHHNVSRLKPHGVWVVISPFNFPAALAGSPSAAALVSGNTVVFKPASDTPFTGLLLTECMRDAGLPDGVFNFVTGPGSSVGEALISNPAADGITFTGSHAVGMHILRTFAGGKYPRPCIAEMGGKNAVIVSRKADLQKAALGVMRSAFGLTGQKCSACSRVYVEKQVKDAFLEKLVGLTSALAVGDPTRQDVFMGPVINRAAYEDYRHVVEVLAANAEILTGGELLTEGELRKGYFVSPTVVANLPLDHPLWEKELFLPIVTVAAVADLDEAMRQANRTNYGLTGGFFSEEQREIQWYLNHIEAGVVYVNREAGATTGAWPGFQPFGGWKASGSTGRGSGGLYYLQQYMREQSQTVMD